MTLDELGTRICIMGPSNSGKSTMAEAISRARRLVPIHLDQLYHLPHTDWVPDRQTSLTPFMTQRLWGRAGSSMAITRGFCRNGCNTLQGSSCLMFPPWSASTDISGAAWFERDRRGALEGGRDSVKWDVIHHITGATRANRNRYQKMFGDIRLPKVRLDSKRALAEFYRLNGLSR